MKMNVQQKSFKCENRNRPRYKIQLAKRMKFKKNEDQSVDTLPFLRNGNKTQKILSLYLINFNSPFWRSTTLRETEKARNISSSLL